jgi:hypothetical protein
MGLPLSTHDTLLGKGRTWSHHGNAKEPPMSQAVLVDDLLNLAREYRQAYYDLRQVAPISWPRYFLFCHSIELVLKAYLAQAAGLTEKQLQDPPFRHNIKNLLDQAIKWGLRLSTNTKASITLLTEAHTTHWPRYPMKKSNTVILIYQCETDADKLLEAIYAALGRSRPF